jgi:hypothetical protein
MITIDQRFNEYKYLYDHHRINEIEYRLYINEIEVQAASIWGSSKVFYDFMNSQKDAPAPIQINKPL